MQVMIRTMTIADAGRVHELTRQLGYLERIEEIGKRIETISGSKNDIAFVAILGGKVEGWAHVFYTIRIETGAFSEVGGLVVDEVHRGKGIGKALINAAIEWSRNEGVATLRVRSNIIRSDAHAFYVNTGFREVKEQKVFQLKLDT
jgi:GNAT superfamily N-acetyltransferase